MKTVQITEAAVLKAHSEATTKGKSLLETLFSGSVFKKDIKERVKSIDDACNVLGDNDKDVIDYRSMQALNLQDHVLGSQELIIITKALNEGWTPDWDNGQWDKWFNWFYGGSSSSGRFSFYDSGDRHSASDCGSRLCFKSSELADYAANQFFDIYKKVYTI